MSRPDSSPRCAGPSAPLTLALDAGRCGTEIRLQAGQHLRFPGLRGWSLRAWTGALWITVDGQAGDIVLAPGQMHVFEEDGAVLVGALDASTLLLRRRREAQVARPPSRTSRLASRLAAWLPHGAGAPA